MKRKSFIEDLFGVSTEEAGVRLSSGRKKAKTKPRQKARDPYTSPILITDKSGLTTKYERFDPKENAPSMKTFDEVITEYGKDNILLRTEHGGYAGLDSFYVAKRPWSAEAEYKILCGLPRAIVWEGDRYTDVNRVRADLDRACGTPQGPIDSANADVLVLSADANGYVPPAKLRTMESLDHYDEMMRRSGCSPDRKAATSHPLPASLVFDGKDSFECRDCVPEEVAAEHVWLRKGGKTNRRTAYVNLVAAREYEANAERRKNDTRERSRERGKGRAD